MASMVLILTGKEEHCGRCISRSSSRTQQLIRPREYPVAEDRGGIEEDFDNYVTLLKRIRYRLNQMGRPIGLSLTLVSAPNNGIPTMSNVADWRYSPPRTGI